VREGTITSRLSRARRRFAGVNGGRSPPAADARPEDILGSFLTCSPDSLVASLDAPRARDLPLEVPVSTSQFIGERQPCLSDFCDSPDAAASPQSSCSTCRISLSSIWTISRAGVELRGQLLDHSCLHAAGVRVLAPWR
jgi:hypothetical protein